MIRTFLALDFQRSTKEKVVGFIQTLKGSPAKVKWVSENNLHLTIKFYGDLNEQQVEKICEEIVSPQFTHPIHYQIAQKGSFPNFKKPKVLWLGIQDNNQTLKHLFLNVEEINRKLHLPLETKNFKPHLTIGRIKFPQDLTKLVKIFQNQPFETINEKSPSLTLYKSELTREGPIYSVLKRINFLS